MRAFGQVLAYPHLCVSQFLIFHSELVSLGVLTIALHMLLLGKMRQACPATRTRNKSFSHIGVGPGTKSIDAGAPIWTMDDVVVHEDPALGNRPWPIAADFIHIARLDHGYSFDFKITRAPCRISRCSLGLRKKRRGMRLRVLSLRVQLASPELCPSWQRRTVCSRS